MRVDNTPKKLHARWRSRMGKGLGIDMDSFVPIRSVKSRYLSVSLVLRFIIFSHSHVVFAFVHQRQRLRADAGVPYLLFYLDYRETNAASGTSRPMRLLSALM